VYVSPPDRPDRMYRRDRPVVPHFDSHELLYLRFGLDDFVDGQLVTAALRIPGQSVNRGSFSSPEDVLFHPEGDYNGLGAVEFKVEDIPVTVVGEQDSTFMFFMQHVPLEENYSHSEVWSDKPPGTGDCRKPSRSVGLKFKAELCRRIREDRIKIPAARNRF
jgi:hypothetical protein